MPCVGYSARGDCQSPPRFVVELEPERNDDTKPREACGRHVGWLIDYRTTPGRAVRVTKIGEKAHGSIG